jgi:hypothetical protein
MSRYQGATHQMGDAQKTGKIIEKAHKTTNIQRRSSSNDFIQSLILFIEDWIQIQRKLHQI